MNRFESIYHGRSFSSFLVGLLIIVLISACWFTGAIIFRIIACILFAVLLDAIYAFLRKREWKFEISDHILRWHYPNGKNRIGEIDLRSISALTIDASKFRLNVILKNGKAIELMFYGSYRDLENYLKGLGMGFRLNYIEDTYR